MKINFPNPITVGNYAKCFEKFKIIDALQQIGGTGAYSQMIRDYANKPADHDSLIETIRTQGLDNESAMRRIVGDYAWGLILRYEPAN